MVKRFKNIKGQKLLYESYERLLGMWGVDKEEKSIETTFGKTHVITSGDRKKPPLLLFHGVGDNSAIMWVYNIQELSKHFFVIAVDTIGGPGKSEPNETYFKNIDQSLWINEILDSLNISRTNIAGVSNGAYLASFYTIKNQERVNKIVCMAGGVTLDMLRKLITFMPEALFPTEKSTKKLLRKLCAPNSDVFERNEELMLHWDYLLKYFNNRVMMYHKYIKFNNDDLEILKDKALFLIGEFDRLVNYPKSIKSLDDNSLTYKIVKDAGHGINHEQYEQINMEIVQFLNN